MLKFLPLLLLLLLCTCGRAPEKEVRIGEALVIPQPWQQTDATGHFTLTDGLTVSIENEDQAQQIEGFLAEITAVTGWVPKVVTGGQADLSLAYNDTLPEEGYALSVTPERISITAIDMAGFFYAIQTLRQLLPPEFASGAPQPGVTWAIPATTITDAPNFGWRGFMLDVSRHFFTVDQVKDVLDQISAQKMNRFHWHLTDDQGWRIEIKAYPKLTSVGAWRADRTNTDEQYSDWWGRAPLQADGKPTYGGFYTQDEIREVVAYAKARHIEVIPEIDMPGHCQAAVAAYPEIGCVKALPAVATGGVFRYNTLNPGKDETYAFVETVLNEVMDLFPFEYLHIGGDECNKEQWKVDPNVQQKMRSEGLKNEAEMQSYFIRSMETVINSRGKKMIGWDEILEGGLAPNAVVMSWRGEEGGLASARAGHEVIMTPNKYCYIDLKQGHDDFEPNLGYSRSLLSDAYNYRVVPADLTAEEGQLIKGIQANLWTESISDWSKFTYMTYPRLFAIAENAWTQPVRKDWDGFTKRLLHTFNRLDAQGVRYAVSAFSPWPHHTAKDGGINVSFTTEANGLDLHYTLNGSDPTAASPHYGAPVMLGPGDKITARNFLDSVAVGYPVSLDLPVHKAAHQLVVDAAKQELPALTNLQYARFTPVDSNWTKFPNEALFDLVFDTLTKVSSLQFSTLRYTISGIYPPETVEVLALGSDGKFQSLATLQQTDEVERQGRNKVVSRLTFPEVELLKLRVLVKTYGTIPEGHHKAGSRGRMYVDELVVE
ncbi:MAG: hexosaminidase [Neolewinella sp.]|jgi:hexosaminidase